MHEHSKFNKSNDNQHINPDHRKIEKLRVYPQSVREDASNKIVFGDFREKFVTG